MIFIAEIVITENFYKKKLKIFFYDNEWKD